MGDGTHNGGVQHHYMHGLCFDGMWDYQTRSRTGRKSWARLDLGSDAYPWAQEDDLEGAGWCVRYCASVLGQRPVSLTHMQKSPVPIGDPANVASTLRGLLPKFEINVQLRTGQEFILKVANTIGVGGGVLARLEREHELRQAPPSWVWIVGMELCFAGVQSSSLLLVSRDLTPAWACGYGAKAKLADGERWTICGVDGQAWSGKFSAMILLRPQ